MGDLKFTVQMPFMPWQLLDKRLAGLTLARCYLPMPSYLIQTTPMPVWGGLAGGIASSVLFVNLDENDNVTIDDNNGVQPGISYNGGVIPPGGSLSLGGNSNWYAVTDASDDPVLQVTPNGGNWTVPIGNIAAEIANSGLALAIAEQIAQQGLALIGAPKALYGGVQVRSGVSGIVGATLDKFAYVPTTSTDFAQYPVWQSKVGRPFNGVRRCYHSEGDPLPSGSGNDGNAASSASNGFKVCFSLKPFRDATNTYGNNKIPGQGNLTFAQHLTAVKAAVVYLQSVCTKGLTVCFWHECNGGGQNGPFGNGGPYGPGVTSPQDATNWITYHNFYEAALNQATNGALTANVERAVCTALFSPNSAILYYPGATHVDVIATDYYAQDLNGSASKTADVKAAVVALQSKAVSDSKKFAYWEIGLTNGSGNPSASLVTDWLNNQITAPLVATGAPVTGDIIWFAAPKSATDAPSRNALGSGAAGACNNATVIAAAASMFDQLSSSPSNVLTVGAGATVIVNPLNPSPGAGYAVADGLSYDITLNITSSGTPTNPFVQAQLQWFNNDATGGIPVETQIWRCPIGNSATAGSFITGVGPQRGQFLLITLISLDTVACTVAIQVNSTSRTQAKHDWIWDEPSSVQIHGYNMASGGSYGNSMGAMNGVSIPAGGQKKYLFGMRAGNACVRFDVPAAGAGINYILAFEPQSDMGSAALINKVLTPASNDYTADIILPRCPISVTAINLDGGAAHNANVQLICEG